MRDLLRVLKALSDSQRLRIVNMLGVRPLCVCEITEVLQLAQSTVSKHLAILRDADLILDEKDGKWVNYSLNTSSGSERMRELLDMVSRWMPDDETTRQDTKRVKTVDRQIICKT